MEKDIRQICEMCGSGTIDDECMDCGHICNDASCVCDHCEIYEPDEDDGDDDDDQLN